MEEKKLNCTESNLSYNNRLLSRFYFYIRQNFTSFDFKTRRDQFLCEIPSYPLGCLGKFCLPKNLNCFLARRKLFGRMSRTHPIVFPEGLVTLDTFFTANYVITVYNTMGKTLIFAVLFSHCIYGGGEVGVERKSVRMIRFNHSLSSRGTRVWSKKKERNCVLCNHP